LAQNHSGFHLTNAVIVYVDSGVFRGRAGGHAPQSSIKWIFLRKKTALLGLVFLPEVFCGPQICQKCVGGPSPIPTRLGAFGASILAPSALSFCAPQCKILAIRPCTWTSPFIVINITKTYKALLTWAQRRRTVQCR